MLLQAESLSHELGLERARSLDALDEVSFSLKLQAWKEHTVRPQEQMPDSQALLLLQTLSANQTLI